MGIAPDKVLTVVDVNRLGWERGRAGDRPGPWRGRENVIDDRNVSGDEPYCSLASGPTSHHAAWPTWTPFSDHHHDVMRAETRWWGLLHLVGEDGGGGDHAGLVGCGGGHGEGTGDGGSRRQRGRR